MTSSPSTDIFDMIPFSPVSHQSSMPTRNGTQPPPIPSRSSEISKFSKQMSIFIPFVYVLNIQWYYVGYYMPWKVSLTILDIKIFGFHIYANFSYLHFVILSTILKTSSFAVWTCCDISILLKVYLLNNMMYNTIVIWNYILVSYFIIS